MRVLRVHYFVLFILLSLVVVVLQLSEARRHLAGDYNCPSGVSDLRDELESNAKDAKPTGSNTNQTHKFDTVPPSPPIWPLRFTREFVEVTFYPILGQHNTSTKYDYDWYNQELLITRENGKYDLLCGFNGEMGISSTPCLHVVTKGRRYLVYPKKKECCFCCDKDHGCGLLEPNWTKYATFMKTMSIPAPNQTVVTGHLWEVIGRRRIQRSLYVDDAGSRKMLVVYHMPWELQVYDPFFIVNPKHGNTTLLREAEEVGSKIMKGRVPGWCDLEKVCDKLSTCALIQSGKTPSEVVGMYSASTTDHLDSPL